MLEVPLKAALAHILGLSMLLVACGQPDHAPASDADAGAEKAPEPKKEKRKATAPANGWGDEIAWRGLSEGLDEAKRERMPLMLVVHTSWCSKCKKLKASTFRDQKLHELSEQFVMINIDQDAEPNALDYAPDGDYIPRVVFLDPDGKVDAELKNSRPSRFSYFYMPQDDLIGTMQKALERHAQST